MIHLHDIGRRQKKCLRKREEIEDDAHFRN